MPQPTPARQTALELIDFIDASPSPWHAVASTEQRLLAHGFARLEEGERWQLAADSCAGSRTPASTGARPFENIPGAASTARNPSASIYFFATASSSSMELTTSYIGSRLPDASLG